MNLERSEKTVFYASVERSIFKNNRLDGLRILSNYNFLIIFSNSIKANVHQKRKT